MLPSLSGLSIDAVTIVDGKQLPETEVMTQNCEICQEQMGPSDDWDVLCVRGHAFHLECIVRHLHAYGTVGDFCPVGRCALEDSWRTYRDKLVQENVIDSPPVPQIVPDMWEEEDENLSDSTPVPNMSREEAFERALEKVSLNPSLPTFDEEVSYLQGLLEQFPDIVNETDSLLLMEAVYMRSDRMIDILLGAGSAIGAGTLNYAFEQYHSVRPYERGRDIFKRLLQVANGQVSNTSTHTDVASSMTVSATRSLQLQEFETYNNIVEYARMYTLELLQLEVRSGYQKFSEAPLGPLMRLRRLGFEEKAAEIVKAIAESETTRVLIHPSFKDESGGKRSLLDYLSEPSQEGQGSSTKRARVGAPSR